MSDDDICGSTDTSSGDPCQFSPAESCPWHDTDDPPDTGRPSKLTYERQEAIAAALEQGKSMNSAARMQGLDPTTVYNWLDRGESEVEEGNENEYAEFFKRVTRARGHGEDMYFKTVWEIAKEEGDHRFLASLMKQRYPDSWGDADTGVEATQIVLHESTESYQEARQQ